MYCKSCGKEIPNGTSCPECGATQSNQQVVDDGGFGWGLLGCCIPIVGLVLFLVWKDTKPKTSKAAGIGALISVVCLVLFYVLMFVIGFGSTIAMPY